MDLSPYRKPAYIEDYNQKVGLFKQQGGSPGELQALKTEYQKIVTAQRISSADKRVLIIPPHTKVTLRLKTYCLNAKAHCPEPDEPYVLTKADPGIPLFSEIMDYTHFHPAEQPLKQMLFWNLRNGVTFEELPLAEQTLLLKIDSMAYIKINNYFKTTVKGKITNYLYEHVPLAGELQDIKNLVQGKAYDYETYTRAVNQARSAIAKPRSDLPIHADGYELYTKVSMDGFGRGDITFFNLTDQTQVIASYFKPLREDVQPLAFDDPPQPPKPDPPPDKCNGQDYDTDTQCCEDAGVLPKGPPISTSLDDCPDRVPPTPEIPFQLDGCSAPAYLLPFLGYDANNPAGGHGTQFSNHQDLPCDQHDKCYQTCGSDKAVCDADLRDSLHSMCENDSGDTIALRKKCLSFVGEYYKAVKYGGAGAFDDDQKRVCQCCP